MKIVAIILLATLLLAVTTVLVLGEPIRECPVGTLPTKVSYEWKNPQGDAVLAKVEGTLCGTYAQEQIVGPYLWEEDFRELLENKGFVILTNPRPLQHAR